MGHNGPEQAWSLLETIWNDLQVCLRLPGIPWSHIFIPRNPPGTPEQTGTSPELPSTVWNSLDTLVWTYETCMPNSVKLTYIVENYHQKIRNFSHVYVWDKNKSIRWLYIEYCLNKRLTNDGVADKFVKLAS